MVDDNEQEDTELVDVSDIEPSFEDEVSLPREEVSRSISGLAAQTDEAGPQIATLRDRFAAFFLDAAFLYFIYWILLILYRSIALESALGPIPVGGFHGILFHSIFLFIAFLWFVVPEKAFGATFGKALCHLTVRNNNGTYPSFLAIVVRNVMRVLDVALLPIYLPVAMMDLTSWHKRLGDWMAGTIVLKNLAAAPKQYSLTIEMLPSTSRRLFAFLVDLILFSIFATGYALLLNPDSRLFSMLLVTFFPLFVFLFFFAPEWLTRTSPGKWLFGLLVCHEDGSEAGISSATVRTLWRLFDTNPFGIFTSLFSIRRQRPGDTAAGSVVIKATREWNGFFALVGIIVISIISIVSGTSNRDSFLSSSFEVNFLPSFSLKGSATNAALEAPQYLMMKNFRFAEGSQYSERKPSIYQPGEVLYMVFEVDGFKREKNAAWIEIDLAIRYPNDTVGLKLEKINEFNRETAKEGPISFVDHIAIPQGTENGRYTVIITIRDRLSRMEVKEQRFFYVTPRTPPPVGEPQNKPAIQPENVPPPPVPEEKQGFDRTFDSTQDSYIQGAPAPDGG